MIKILSNPRFLHLFYLSAMALLWYVLWFTFPNPKLLKSFERITSTLEPSQKIVEQSNDRIRKETGKMFDAYKNPINQRSQEELYHIGDCSNHCVAELDTIKGECILANFFDNAHLSKIRLLLYDYQKQGNLVIRDTKDREQLQKNNAYFIEDILNNDAYWIDFKTLPHVCKLAELTRIQNTIVLCTNSYFNYFACKTGCGIKFDKFRVGISASRGSIKVGEEMDADIFLTDFASRQDKTIKIFVDDKPLEVVDGIAHYKQKFDKIGKHTIKLRGVLSNPFDSIFQEISTSEYTFEVLPK